MSINYGFVLWRPGSLTVHAVIEGTVDVRGTIAIPTLNELEFQQMTTVWSGSHVLLRTPDRSTRSPFVVSTDNGYTFTPLSAIPGTGPLEISNCKLHMNGACTLIRGDSLWVHKEGDCWKDYPLPAGFSAYDVSVTARGDIYLTGAVDSSRTSSGKHALARIDSGGVAFEAIPLRGRDRRRVSHAVALTHINGESHPLVLGGSYYTLEDEIVLSDYPSHSLLLIEDKPRWNSRFIRGELYRVVRNNVKQLTVFLSSGERHRTWDSGRTWTDDSLIQAFRSAAEVCRLPHIPTLTSVDTRDGIAACSVTTYEPGNGEKRIVGSSVLLSLDDGHSFEKGTHVSG